MAAYCRVYDSCHLQADCQEPGSAPEPDNRVWATFTFLGLICAFNCTFSKEFLESRHLTSTTKRSVLGGDAALHQITSTACSGRWSRFSAPPCIQTAVAVVGRLGVSAGQMGSLDGGLTRSSTQ